jgi:hypothetical protein
MTWPDALWALTSIQHGPLAVTTMDAEGDLSS